MKNNFRFINLVLFFCFIILLVEINPGSAEVPTNIVYDKKTPVITVFNGNGAYHPEISKFEGKCIEWGYEINHGEILTEEILFFTDILILNAPGYITLEQQQLIESWWNSGNHTLWIVGESDYGGYWSPNDINKLSVSLGLSIIIQDDAVRDPISNDGADYRPIANESNPLYKSEGNLTWHVDSILPYTPTNVVPYIGGTDGSGYMPQWNNEPTIDWVMNYSAASSILDQDVDNDNIWEGIPSLVEGQSTAVAVQWKTGPYGGSKAIWSGESIFADYNDMFTNSTRFTNNSLQSVQLTYNLLNWAQNPAKSVIKDKPTILVYNRGSYHTSMVGFISNVSSWGYNLFITDVLYPHYLDYADLLILNGNGHYGASVGPGLTEVERNVIKIWWDHGNKSIWIAGDSDYGGYWKPDELNILALQLGSQIILQDDAIDDPVSNDGATYCTIANKTNPSPQSGVNLTTIQNISLHGPTFVVPYSGGMNGTNTMPSWSSLSTAESLINYSKHANIQDQDFDSDNIWEGIPPETEGECSAIAVQWNLGSWNNSKLILTGESIFTDYKNMFGYSGIFNSVKLQTILLTQRLLEWSLDKNLYFTEINEIPEEFTITDLRTNLVVTNGQYSLPEGVNLNFSFLLQSYPNNFIGSMKLNTSVNGVIHSFVHYPIDSYFNHFSGIISENLWSSDDFVEIWIDFKNENSSAYFIKLVEFNVSPPDTGSPIIIINYINPSTDEVLEDQDVEVSVAITDNVGVVEVNLICWINDHLLEKKIPLSSSTSTYTVKIPKYDYGSRVYWFIQAVDGNSNYASTKTYSYFVLGYDHTAPIINNVNVYPGLIVEPFSPIIISVNTHDAQVYGETTSGISTVEITISRNGMLYETSYLSYYSNNDYKIELDGFSANSVIEFWIKVTDNNGLTNSSPVKTVNIKISETSTTETSEISVNTDLVFNTAGFTYILTPVILFYCITRKRKIT